MRLARTTLAGFLVACSTAGSLAAEGPDFDARLKEMTQRIFAMKPSGEKSKDLTFRPDPLLRYSDPTRAIVDATVWSLGAKGRPQGIVVLERYENDRNNGGRSHWSYELTVTSKEVVESLKGPSWEWRPDGKRFDWTDIEAEAPAETKIQRGRQMKELARSFDVTEDFEGKHHLRVLPQPLLRYEDEKANIIDANIFAVVHGTNVELLLVMEARQDASRNSWKVGFARLGAAPLTVTRKDMPVWEVGWCSAVSRSYMFKQAEMTEAKDPPDNE